MNTKKERDLNLLKKKQGFTLVEVLVVLVILAILIAIAVPSVTAYIGKAKDRKDLIELNNVKKAFELMMLEDVENGYFGSSTSEESNDESNFLYNNATNFIYGVGDDSYTISLAPNDIATAEWENMTGRKLLTAGGERTNEFAAVANKSGRILAFLYTYSDDGDLSNPQGGTYNCIFDLESGGDTTLNYDSSAGFKLLPKVSL